MRVAHEWFSRERYSEALAWGLSLSHPDLDSVGEVFSFWTAGDPGAARRWLDESNVPEDAREMFRKRLSDLPP